jgi:hypothetical protein
VDIPVPKIKELLQDNFNRFDIAVYKQSLLRDPDSLFCPGVDCDMVYLKPANKKGVSQCRVFTCSCKTSMCIYCGLAWTDGHLRKGCKEYARELEQAKGLLEFKKQAKAKACPKCKRITEKNGGCSSHTCTACDT